MHPAALLLHLRIDLLQRPPEPQRPVPHRQRRSVHPPPLQVPQHRQPRFLTLPVALLQGDHFLGAVRPHSHDHQAGQPPIFLQAHGEVHSVHPPVEIRRLGQVPFPPRVVFRLPDLLEPHDRGRGEPLDRLPEQLRQGGGEVPRGQAPQIQDRQHLVQPPAPPHVGREDLARELGALAPIIHPRGLQLQRQAPHNHRARLR